MMEIEESHEQQEQERNAKFATLLSIGLELEKKKETAIAYRQPYEDEWVTSYKQFHGDDSLRDAKNYPGTNVETYDYQKTRDNITKNKTLMVYARMADGLFPTNEPNWDIAPTPMPETADPDAVLTLPDGTQASVAEIMAAKQEQADKACTAMKRHISDQLDECHYAKTGRAAIWNSCIYGTGVIEAPVVKNTTKKVWKTDPASGVSEYQILESQKPTAEYVDLWDFYPLPCRNIEECEGAFTLKLMTRAQVQSLARQPGFDIEQLAVLLKQNPALGSLPSTHFIANSQSHDGKSILEGKYPIWVYTGGVSKQCFECLGTPEDELAELDDSVMAKVWFSGGIIIRANIWHLEGNTRLPFYVSNYLKNPASIFGYGVPHACRTDQKAVDQTWQMIMLNGSMSAAPQIGVMRSALTSADGKQTERGSFRPKYWYLNDDNGITDIRQAMSAFVVPNNLDSLIPLYQKARDNADERVMMPEIAQGQPSQNAQTASGTEMLLNAHNIIQKMFFTNWDDDVTVPLIEAFYDHNMLHNDDPSCKGDFMVSGRGSSHLLIKEAEASKFLALTQLAQQPNFAHKFNFDKMAEKAVEYLSGDFREVLKSDDEVKAAQEQQQQEDPRITVEKMRQETEAQRMQLELQIAAMRAETEAMVAQKNLEIAYLNSAKTEQIKLAEIDAKVDIAKNKEDTNRFIGSLHGQLKAHEIAQKSQKVDAQIAAERPLRL